MIEERLRKIKALADRGTDGERTAARRLLEELLVKYGLTAADLEGVNKPKHRFTWRTRSEYQLLCHILCTVTDEWTVETSRVRGGRTMSCLLTEDDAREVRRLYACHRNAFKAEVGRLETAYINRHHLFPASPRPKEDDDGGGDVNIDDLRQIADLMSVLRDVPVPAPERHQLNHPEESSDDE